ncbi:putative UBP type Zn finger protein [Actinoplanes lutulentus]|uniref:Ubiquitin-hydrolase Zn-finger-containing protein n=1 Tax=Actinoplanes lutulentus TaxID=1287878 RepID=A0A327ZFY9_9ACTN|nr:UBP-type zinc finger domain-containing protein [Actinoplanes lutulentus]MBB2942816.1 putative UBP type Zn finger protein [Actinoplanes lutulentus]RAK38395.1 ubiquitin-hydrolase Zn-finger-containing protein [Actinoplanes lutulentus]
MTCEHLKEAGNPAPLAPYDGGCPQCVAGGFSDWVHLRACLTCGYVGCCDSSPRRHMSLHHDETSHPVMRSYEPGETWRWCYVDQQLG